MLRRTPMLPAGVLLLLAAGLASCAPGSRKEAPAGEAARPVPEVVTRMVEAHGGIEAWRRAPSVRFKDACHEGEKGKPVETVVTVEGGRRRSTMEVPATTTRVGWDGERAWSLNWKGAPPRFVAQLNYYFLNLPWLTMDPGVRLEPTGTKRLWEDPTDYATVKMTFDEGVGDTPRDYYELYIDPATHRLRACGYIVTYRGILPPGVERTPEHILVFDELTTVDGLLVPTRYTIYEQDKRVYFKCGVTDWSFTTPFDPASAAMPAGAVVDTTTP